jgi:hypothetical protein
MDWQLVLAIACVLGSACYVGRQILRAWLGAGGKCGGCSCADRRGENELKGLVGLGTNRLGRRVSGPDH